MSQTQMDSLGQAQLQINRILELLGRIFAASKGGNRSAAVAATTKLKQILPLSINNFHNALDEIDQQLQMAKLTLRRDLALATEQKLPVEEPVQEVPADAAVEKVDESNVGMKNEDQSSNTDDAPAMDESTTVAADPIDVEMTNGTEKQELKLDTKPDTESKPDDAEKAPDTAFSNNADMESLFNDPTSAEDLPTSNAADSFDFATANDDTVDFDLGEFTNGLDTNNDGLNPADFAGTVVEHADVDFSDLFGPAVPTDDNTQTQSQDSVQQFNFDDLMDLALPSVDAANESAETATFDFS